MRCEGAPHRHWAQTDRVPACTGGLRPGARPAQEAKPPSAGWPGGHLCASGQAAEGVWGPRAIGDWPGKGWSSREQGGPPLGTVLGGPLPVHPQWVPGCCIWTDILSAQWGRKRPSSGGKLSKFCLGKLLFCSVLQTKGNYSAIKI